MVRQRQVAPLTPRQAQYVLDRLLRERRVKPGEVERMAAEMEREIAELESRLAMLRGDAARAKSGARTSGRTGSASKNMDPALAASRRLQGEYMGLLRRVENRDRARIKKIATEKGREAAVREMKALLR